jgi:small subunit ribosomal protein S13
MKIAGTEINDHKHIVISLCSIFGIGKSLSIKILTEANIPLTKKVKDLSLTEQQTLSNILNSDQYLINTDLRKTILSNIERLVSIRCYRGIRLKKGLPAHGQNTHTNAKTAKRNSLFKSKKEMNK